MSNGRESREQSFLSLDDGEGDDRPDIKKEGKRIGTGDVKTDTHKQHVNGPTCSGNNNL